MNDRLALILIAAGVLSVAIQIYSWRSRRRASRRKGYVR